MDVPVPRKNPVAEPDDQSSVVCSHETRPGKVVFTERNNTDGWIATDLTVELER